MKKRRLAILTRIGGDEHATSELSEIKASLESSAGAQTGSVAHVFSKQMKTVMVIGLGIAFFQQITGINAIFYYAPMIFEMAGGGKDAAFMQASILGLTNLVMTLVAMALIDRLGRRPLLIIGASGLTIALVHRRRGLPWRLIHADRLRSYRCPPGDSKDRRRGECRAGRQRSGGNEGHYL